MIHSIASEVDELLDEDYQNILEPATLRTDVTATETCMSQEDVRNLSTLHRIRADIQASVLEKTERKNVRNARLYVKQSPPSQIFCWTGSAVQEVLADWLGISINSARKEWRKNAR